MRRAARIDANQPEIVKAFRELGATVSHTHMVGAGFPDIVVGMRTAGGDLFNLLIEIKDGSKSKSAQKLTKDEQKWHDAWGGSVHIVRNVDEVKELYWDVYDVGGVI